MQKSLAAALAFVMILSAAIALAGGPVRIFEVQEVVAEKPHAGFLLPLIVTGIILCVVLCSGDDDGPDPAGSACAKRATRALAILPGSPGAGLKCNI
jgi:hypothetical protein